jgi:hypothetical protein
MKRICLLVLLFAGSAGAQTLLDQEQRLIEIHSLLVGLEPETSPGAYAPGQLSLGLELIVIPTINGQTGGKTQITASDRTRVFPRPRLAIGLPAPEDFRAYLGVSYVPPVQINSVSSHQGAVELGYAWAPPGPLTIGLRGYALFAESKSPVTDLNCQSTQPAILATCTRDTLDTFDLGVDLSAGYRFDFAPGSLTPFAGVGLTYVDGNFRVSSDHDLLTSTSINPGINAGVRIFSKLGIEALAELVVYPGRLIHPVFGLAWTPDWFAKHKS